jgi:hypothetical protein
MAAKELDLNEIGISRVLRGKAKTCGNYTFSYVNQQR